MSRTLCNRQVILDNQAAFLAATNGWATGTTGVDIALFSNDYVPAGDDTPGNFDAVTVAGAAVKTAVITAAVTLFPDGTIAIVVGTLEDFKPTVEPDPAVTAYGYFVVGNDNGKLLAARRFDDPIQLHDGESVLVNVIVPAPLVWQFNDPALP